MKNGTFTAKLSCYIGYIVQGVINNFTPLLFVYFQDKYAVSVSALAFVALYSFAIQIAIDLLSSLFIEKIGYKKCGIYAEILVIIGLVLLAFLPRSMNAVAGIIIASTFYCVGGGLIEVCVSPIIEKLPSKHKAFEMGLAHAMYCIGAFITIVFSFFFFLGLSVSNWWILCLIFLIVPIAGLILFCFGQYPEVVPSQKEKSPTLFFRKSSFYLLCGLMLFSGATEIGMATWISNYAEVGLKVEKPYGDLYGPALFALAMAATRFVYAFLSNKIKVERLLIIGASIATCGYLLASLSSISWINFAGAILVGVGVASLWPGTVSISASYFPTGGKIYSFLAMFGDIGCCLGTYSVGLLSSSISLKYAMLVATIFPFLFILTFMLLSSLTQKNKQIKE